MRYAIYVVSSGKYDQAMIICKLLRRIDLGKKLDMICRNESNAFHQDFDMISSLYMPQLGKKLGALKQSIRKVEQGT
jgi:hypothetical protein